MIDKMDEFLAAAVPAILQLITGLAVMCWLFGGEDRRILLGAAAFFTGLRLFCYTSVKE